MIFDNGDGFDPAQERRPEGGVGLSNVHGRLQEAYGTHYSLQIEKRSPTARW
jgi:sensor histidine kinase YesM